MAGKVVICNHILLSTLWFLTMVWGCSNKRLRKIINNIHNHLWFGKKNLTHIKVSWRECCLKKKYGGLGFANPEVAKTCLLCKWIIKSMEPGKSNLHLILRYRLAIFEPPKEEEVGELTWIVY